MFRFVLALTMSLRTAGKLPSLDITTATSAALHPPKPKTLPSTFQTALAPLPGAADLRERACSLSQRRHTLIQVQLAAAQFNTNLHVARESQDSLSRVWDDYVMACSEARRLDDAAGRKRNGVARQLDKLSMYLAHVTSRRHSQPTSTPRAVGPPSLRASEHRKFEVLWRKAAGASSGPPDSTRTAGFQRRRGVGAVSIVPTLRAPAMPACRE